MASTQAFQKIILTSDDVPGAKIDTDQLENYGNVQLQRWLACRGLKTSGNRSDLFQRCKDAASTGKAEDIDITIDGGKWYDVKLNQLNKAKEDKPGKHNPLIPPVLGWKPFPSTSVPQNFNYGHIYHYLLESVVLIGEGNKAEDTNLSHMTSKPLTKGEQYVKSGSVTDVMDTKRDQHYFVKAKVSASMRNEQRTVHVTLSCLSGAVRDASCTCPGSALGRCNHVAAVLLQVDKHCKEFGHDPVACTSKPCEWGKGQKRTKTPGKVADVAYTSYKGKQAKLSDFDPRPANLRKPDKASLRGFISNLKYDGLSYGKTSMWESLLPYDYSDYDVTTERKGWLTDKVSIFFSNLKEECVKFDSDTFMVPNTETQSDSFEWNVHRWFRITASTAKTADTLGSLLMANPTDATLRKLQAYVGSNVWNLHPYTSPDMMYGIEQEDKAREDYIAFKKLQFPEIKVAKTGFWINKLWPELGCSPDGLICDASEDQKHGLIEIKCLKLFRTKVAPADLFKSLEKNEISKKDLYSACFKIPTCDNCPLELKKTSLYYYQVQFQLAITGLKWCDFMLWSPLGAPNIERIRRDDQFIISMIGNVTTLWWKVVAPEIFEMRVPRKLKPINLD